MFSPRRTRPSGAGGFTLIELLVVILIILLVSIVTLPTVVPALQHRQVSEAARILQSALAGARDQAIRADAPRGIRLLPDPGFPPSTFILASNRWVAIEPATDYTEGQVLAGVANPATGFLVPAFVGTVQVRLAVQEAKLLLPNGTLNASYAPTSWFWNIRQGDKIRFGDSGNTYTVAGPIGPPGGGGIGNSNPERFINFGLPSATNISLPSNSFTEFLFLVNNQDDDFDGFVDEAFDGVDNDGDGIIDPGYNGLDDNGDGNVDEPAEMLLNVQFDPLGNPIPGTGEFEPEVFIGAQASLFTNLNQTFSYTIYRRPVVSPGAREVSLPSGVVIDLTTWNAPNAFSATNALQPSRPERSRLPVDPGTLTVDVMLNPNGSIARTSMSANQFNSLAQNAQLPFYHFWLAEREDVVAPPTKPNPNQNKPGQPFVVIQANPNWPTQTFLLPMPKGTPNYGGTVFLKGERRLVTVYARSGQILTTDLAREPIPTGVGFLPGSFDGNDTDAPYYDAQVGAREIR